MRSSLPPIQWLRSFEAAARNLSFTKAADELGLTQSAVSQQLHALENWYGYPLFLRKGRGVVLTNEANTILPSVREGLDILVNTLGRIEHQHAVQTLTVSVSNSLLYAVIAPSLSEFTQEFRVNIRLHSNIWPDGQVPMKCDLDIRFANDGIEQFGFIRLVNDRVILIHHPMISHKNPFDSYCLIETIGSNDRFADLSKQYTQLTVPKSSIQVDHYGSALALAKAGNGIALCSEAIAKYAIRSGEVDYIDGIAMPAKSSYYAKVVNPNNDMALAFSRWLTQKLSQ